MTDNIKNILEIYDSILANKKNISEAVLSSPIAKLNVTSQYGVKRPYETHPGVDLGIPSGSEVRSPEDGIVIDQADDSKRCGGKIFIDHENGYKSRYCHMKDIRVKKGDRVKKGELIGLSGGARGEKGAGNSTGPHLHFEVYKDGKLVNPMDHIDKEMSIYDDESSDKSDSKSISTDSSGTTDSSKTTSIGDDILGNFIDKLAKAVGLTEGKIYGPFGRNVQSVGSSYLISKDRNSKISSPISGQINNKKFRSSCKNQVTVDHDIDGRPYHLQFCGISTPNVRDGQMVSQGDLLGKTFDDVIVTLYNDNWEKMNLVAFSKKESKGKQEKGKVTSKSNDMLPPKKEITPYTSKSGYQDFAVDVLGSVLSYPFRAIDRMKRDKKEKEKEKIQENIKRIKKLLK